jgi:hypothetical protein
MPSLVSRMENGELRWRDPARGSTVAVFLQSDDRAADLAYLRGLTESARDFQSWDGRVIAVVPRLEPSSGESGQGLPSAGPELDTDGTDRSAPIHLVTQPTGEAEHCGVRGGEDAVLIADRWGQIYHGARGEAPDALPTPAEIEEWLQFIATQCPECGVIDEP